MTETVRMDQMEAKVRESIPGASVRPGGAFPDLGTIVFQLNMSFNYWEIPADYADEYLARLVEQFKIRAIRELGLADRLAAYELEAKDLRSANHVLGSQLKQLREQLGAMAMEKAELKARLALLQEDPAREDPAS